MTSHGIAAKRARALNLAARPARRLLSRRRIAAGTAALRDGRVLAGPAPAAVVSSYRIADEARLRMLRLTVAQLATAFAGSDVRFVVGDASPPEYAEVTEEIWRQSALRVDWRPGDLPLVRSLDEILADLPERYFCLQFDDMVSVGLSPAYLAAATRVLGGYGPEVGAVSPFWPVSVEVPVDRATVEVIAYRRGRSGVLGFREHEVEPLTELDVDDHRFAIVENFTYGFFFNALIASSHDYLARLRRYRRLAATGSAHGIENYAASKLRGPYWTHIAVPLDRATLLDLDYSHTGEALRAQAPEKKQIVEALESGARIDVRVG